MRNIPDECKQIEAQLKASDYTLADLFYNAGLTRQAWQTWRRGSCSPTIQRWDEMEHTLTDLLAHKIKVVRRDR
jgi:hypothetical protein